MILTADWVIHAHESESSDETKPCADLRKKVLSYHKEMGMGEAFRYVAEDDEYYETADYEMSSANMMLIDELSEISFWRPWRPSWRNAILRRRKQLSLPSRFRPRSGSPSSGRSRSAIRRSCPRTAWPTSGSMTRRGCTE